MNKIIEAVANGRCSLRPPAVANAFHSGHSAEQNGRPYLIN